MQNSIAQLIGNVEAPPGVEKYTSLTVFLSNILKLLIVGAGIYALFNVALAGYAFLSAGDDPKKIAGASGKIWQSLIGLLIAAGSVVLAAIFGELIFGEWDALLKITIYGPG